MEGIRLVPINDPEFTMNYLNLGCGLRFHPDWVNVDFVSSHPSVSQCDLRKGIPYPDKSFGWCITPTCWSISRNSDALGFLKECHRVVQPNGTIRVAVPDLEGIVKAYLQALDMAAQGEEQGMQNHEWMMLEMYDQVVRQRSCGSMFEYLKKVPCPMNHLSGRGWVAKSRAFLRMFAASILNHPGSIRPFSNCMAVFGGCRGSFVRRL